MDDENLVNVAADIEEVREVILALMPRIQEKMRGMNGISSQPNSTPMPGPHGRRNNHDQDRPVFGKMHR